MTLAITAAVSTVTIKGDEVATIGSKHQYSATILPTNAANKIVTWSVINGNGTATINATSGELTAGNTGTVTVKATVMDGSGIVRNKAVTIIADSDGGPGSKVRTQTRSKT